MTIPKLTPYTGQVANPDGSQTQTEFTQNMFDQLSYEAQFATELDATIDGMNQAVTNVEANAATAQNSSDAAQAAANFDGGFTVGVTSALEGKSYLYSGDIWLCLQNTTTTPSTGSVAWKLSVGEQYVTEAQGELINGQIFPSSGVVKNGDAIPAETTHLRVLVDGEPGILIAWDTLTLPATVTSVPVANNGYDGYDVVTDQGTFEFVTLETYELRKDKLVEGWGARREEDDSQKILEAITYNQNDGGGAVTIEKIHDTSATLLPDSIDAARKHFIKGVKSGSSVIRTTLDGVSFYIGNGFDTSDLNIYQVGAQGTGRAISTTDARQSANGSMARERIKDFRFGVWKRYSIWDSYKDLYLDSNTCGIRLSRHDYQVGNANPDAPGGWNFNPGWFHNVITMDNVYCEGGEVGIWAASMCATYNAVTCQGQNTDGTSNDVLPSGQKGTGIMLDTGSDSSQNGYNNQIISYYSENTEIGMMLKSQRYVGVDGFFIQGGTSGNPAEAAVVADRSLVEINGGITSEYFDDAYKAVNGSTIFINHRGGPTIGNLYSADATSRIKMRGTVDKAKYEYSINRPLGGGTLTYTLTQPVPQKSTAKIYFTGLYDGFSLRNGEVAIRNWSSSTATTVEWLSDGGVALPQTVVSASNGGTITIEISGTQQYLSSLVLEIIGGENVSGTPISLAGV